MELCFFAFLVSPVLLHLFSWEILHIKAYSAKGVDTNMKRSLPESLIADHLQQRNSRSLCVHLELENWEVLHLCEKLANIMLEPSF